MNHTKINLILIVLVFTATLFAPAFKTLVKPGHSHPLLEKRRLQDRPELPTSFLAMASFPKAFEGYFKDNFEFRYNWLNTYKLSKLKINDPADGNVIFGNETGWLFFNDRDVDDVVGDFRNINQFTATELDLFISYLQSKQQWLAKQGIEYMFVLAPSKHYVYPEYLPSKYRVIDQKNIKIQLAESLKKHPEINFLDLTKTIRKGKSEQQMYFKNDTHWTDYATNLAQYALSQKLENIFPNHITAIKKPWSEFTNKQLHQGDLEQINGLLGQFPDYRHLPSFTKCAENLMPQKLNTTSTFSTDCNKPLRALVFRDSFFSNLQPFISEHLGLSRFVWQKMSFKEAEKHITDIHPHVVIEEWIDRHLPQLVPPN